MKYLVVLVFSAFFASPVLAEKFIDVSDMDHSASPFFKSRLMGYSGSHTFITSDGYFLTAAHNLLTCMNNRGNYTINAEGNAVTLPKDQQLLHRSTVSGILIGEGQNVTPLEIVTFNMTALKRGILCDVGHQKLFQAEIVALGSTGYIPAGMYFDFQEQLPDLFKKYQDLGFTGVGGPGDFALMKLIPHQTSEKVDSSINQINLPSSCLPLSEDGPVIGERIYSLNFPSSQNYLPSFTEGITYSEDTNPLFVDENLSVRSPHELYGSIASWGGSSGGAVVSWNDNKVVGLIHKRLSTDPVDGATAFINSKHMSQVLRQQLGNEFFENKLLNNCEATPHRLRYIDQLKKNANIIN